MSTAAQAPAKTPQLVSTTTPECSTASGERSGSAPPPFLDYPCIRRWSGNAHNTALAQIAAMEDCDAGEGAVEEHAAELANAPMFRLLVDEYERALASGGDPGVHLALFSARLFMAGDKWDGSVS